MRVVNHNQSQLLLILLLLLFELLLLFKLFLLFKLLLLLLPSLLEEVENRSFRTLSIHLCFQFSIIFYYE